MSRADWDQKRDRAALKKPQQDDGWDAILRRLSVRLDSLARRAAETGGQNEFQELKALHQAQGGRDELRRFFDDLEKDSFDED